jgi:hypothetical protein
MSNVTVAKQLEAGHPNRLPFRGVLTLIDTPSERPPGGARGHRVLLTHAAAEQALPTLLGMSLNFTPVLDTHDSRYKIGIITSAELVDKTIEIRGHIFAKDFPDVVRKLRAAQDSLGMSYDVSDAKVANVSAQIWVLTQVIFIGASVLKKSKAAYDGTSIELEVSDFQLVRAAKDLVRVAASAEAALIHPESFGCEDLASDLRIYRQRLEAVLAGIEEPHVPA